MKNKLIVMLCLLMLGMNVSADIPILLYHNVSETYVNGQADMHITPDMFEEHMKTLNDAGYHAVSITDVVSGVAMPENPIVITFDDGYYSNYEFAYPVLQKYNMCGTIFVITDKMGNFDTSYRHFDWQTAREMENSGIIEILSHTNSHSRLSQVSDIQLVLELRQSKYIIEKELEKKCNILAAPYGDFDERTFAQAKKAGYDAICRVGDIGIDVPTHGLLSLRRYTVHGDMNGADLLNLIK